MMKHHVRYTVVLAALTPISVLAVDAIPSEPSDAAAAFQAWFHERSEREVARKMEMLDRGEKLPDGEHRILSVADLQASAAVRTHVLAGISKRTNRVLEVGAGVLPAESELLRELHLGGDEVPQLQRRVRLPLSNLSQTLLGAAKLLAAKEAGARGSEGATGASRFFQVSGVGIIEFFEEDYRALGTVIETFREALDAEVNGTPAMLNITRGADGRGRIALSWIDEVKSYGLTLTTDHAEYLERDTTLIRRIASAIRD